MIIKRHHPNSWEGDAWMDEREDGDYVEWSDVQALLAHIEQRHGIVIEYRHNTSEPAALAPGLDTLPALTREPGRDEPLPLVSDAVLARLMEMRGESHMPQNWESDDRITFGEWRDAIDSVVKPSSASAQRE